MFTADMRDVEEKFFALMREGPVTKGLTKFRLDITDRQWDWLYRKDIYKPVIEFVNYYIDHENRTEGSSAQKYARILAMWLLEGNKLILRDPEAGEYFLANPDSGDQFYNAEIVETKKAEHHAKCLGTVGRRMRKQKMIPPTIPDRFLKSSGYIIESENNGN